MHGSGNLTLRQLTLCALSVFALAACSKKDDTTTDTTAAVTPAPAAAPGPVDSANMNASAPTSGADVSADPAISSFTDANIVAKMEEGDSKEVQLASGVASRATNPEVKDYAKMLVTDHSKARTEDKTTATKARIAPQPPAGDSSRKELSDLKERFAKLKGADLDSAFINYAIEDHKKDIADSKAMQQQAKSQDLKDAIQKDMPTLQKHLDKAQEIAGKLH